MEYRGERRLEVREGAGGAKVLCGRAVVYDSWSVPIPPGNFIERIQPGAFDDAFQHDIVCSVQHCPDKLLGRTAAGTLRLFPSAQGIDMEVDVSGLSYAQDLVISIQRGDLVGCSFIMDIQEDSWQRVNGQLQRTILKADLFETSFVFYPAYESTSVGLRATSPR